MSDGPILLESAALSVSVTPRVGGAITGILHRPSGLSVLGTVPWDPLPEPLGVVGAPDEASWLPRYTGGWPIMFPNGGDSCQFEGAFHGFHGEASVVPWAAERDGNRLRLRRRLFTVPVEMRREIAVEGDLVTVRESVRLLGERPIRVMWGHHPTFGSDLIAAPYEIAAPACKVTVEDSYDPPANPLQPGATGTWPVVPGRDGPFDLRRPSDRIAACVYLHDLDSAWLAIRRRDDAVAVALSWDQAIFPCAWLWLELAGTAEPPWHGITRLIGLEPNASWPGVGLAESARRGRPLLTLEPGVERTAWVRLHVLQPQGPIAGVDAQGRAVATAD
jgi:galactose mutarotase-like enzyme